jgi:hypothetical protein
LEFGVATIGLWNLVLPTLQKVVRLGFWNLVLPTLQKVVRVGHDKKQNVIMTPAATADIVFMLPCV